MKQETYIRPHAYWDLRSDEPKDKGVSDWSPLSLALLAVSFVLGVAVVAFVWVLR